ncbi:MAG: TrkH family potassium uptake protein [Theionarchaea archaeon]|nr:TrkH family potassium uptake protein [Theionarchaea archaeon]MBU6999489.1 TrkH family potassium uptake protein [Theionarchaea archaeon]MBU7021741.1 TrkH family potassium uptake protein [Theionarchaea archaeon]MBU7034518.1 TrkH family potassium uptake protein [Theionarchaea archaeon]MBU7041005.1 TrkH family potassium uptake protein [Theionarchaea archaeon]
MKSRVVILHNIHVVFNFLGSTFLVLSGILLIPLLVAILTGEIEDIQIVKAFVYPAGLSLTAGITLRGVFRGGSISPVQALFICTLGWLGFSAVGGIPFVIAVDHSYIDSVFEAMSGFTTTGMTLFTGLDALPRTILFWRSFTQFLGGLGILTFFLAITYQGESYHRLFGAESHKIDVRRPVPGLANTVSILWSIYTGLTICIALALMAAGMSPFDSVCHSFTTLSTGGFSPHDASIGYYAMIHHPHSVLIEYILIFGMILGGINFLVHYRVLKKDVKALWDNVEMKYWWGFILLFCGIILAERMHAVSFTELEGLGSIEEHLRKVLFQVTAIITTTGFSTVDIGSSFFGEVARQLFLVLMVVGGCVGSTGGGFKVLRVAILRNLIGREVFRLRTPRPAISSVVIDGKPVGIDEIQRVGGLFFAWIILIVVGGVITAFLSGLSGYESFSGMFSAMGNVGPSFISVQAMASFSPILKVVYIGAMLAGRLEILPVLLLLSPRAWSSKGIMRR